MKQIITDYRTSTETIAELEKLGFSVVKTIPIQALYNEVNGHGDMQIHVINDMAVCEPTVYKYYKSSLKNIHIVCGSVLLNGKYPNDIAYNTCQIGEYAICKISNTAKEILEKYRQFNYKIINTKQGYTKCSICVVDKYSAITSDAGLYKLLTKIGLNILKIEPGYINLGSMEGFIGGASGLLNANLLAFNGNISSHPDYKNIKSFCKNCGVDIISLNNNQLTDIGSLIVI